MGLHGYDSGGPVAAIRAAGAHAAGANEQSVLLQKIAFAKSLSRSAICRAETLKSFGFRGAR
jgi:hypothetical protein